MKIPRSLGWAMLVFTLAALSPILSQLSTNDPGLIAIAQQSENQSVTITTTQAGNVTTSTPPATNTTVAVNITGTNTTTAVENVTANMTTITVVSYITLPPVTRPPSNTEIAGWISGGVVTGILIGLSVGYAVFAKGVSIRRQQVGKAGAKGGEKRKK